MGDAEGISFSSFLAGALLRYGSVSDCELACYITSYENINLIDIYEDDIYNLYDIVYYANHSFRLKKSFDETYNGNYTVREYLYKMTNSRIRKFFGIEEIQISESNIFCPRKIGIIKKIRTRVLNLL